MLTRSNEFETAVNGCHCSGYMAVRTRKDWSERREVFVCYFFSFFAFSFVRLFIQK